jgi:hypothetical protein
MARLYADEDVPRPLVEHLRAMGHDVLTALEAGQANRQVQDPSVLAQATTLGRVVVTHNRKDFKRLHATTPGTLASSVAPAMMPTRKPWRPASTRRSPPIPTSPAGTSV